MKYNRDKNYMREISMMSLTKLNTKMKMRKTERNLRNMAMITCLIISILFVGCNKDDDDIGNNASIIEAKNVEGVSSEVVTVEVGLAYYDGLIATGDFKNGGFKVKLPKTLSDEYLESVEEEYISGTASDKNAKITDLYTFEIWGLDAKGNYVGGFELIDDECFRVTYVYADRKVTLKGKGKDGEDLDCSFKKGWNIIYINGCSNGGITTTKPSGVTFKWYYYD